MKKLIVLMALLFMQSVQVSAETEFTLAVPETDNTSCSGPGCNDATSSESASRQPNTPKYSNQLSPQTSPVKKVQTGKVSNKGKVAKPDGNQPQSFPAEVDRDSETKEMPSTRLDGEVNSQVAMPEITQRALLSRSDVNRIVCKEPIKDIFFSDEKGLEKPSYSGNSAFVKFRVKKTGSAYEYVTMPIDLTIICGESVYTLIGFPKALPSQTIRLDSGTKARARENMTIFKDQPERVKAKALIERAYKEDIPASFTTKILDRQFTVFKNISTSLHRIISVDGEGLIIKEFYVVPHVESIELNEKDFLRKEFTENPFALGLTELRPGKKERSRLFIVETKGSSEGDANVR